MRADAIPRAFLLFQIAVLFIVFPTCGCSVQKRVYRKGFYVQKSRKCADPKPEHQCSGKLVADVSLRQKKSLTEAGIGLMTHKKTIVPIDVVSATRDNGTEKSEVVKTKRVVSPGIVTLVVKKPGGRKIEPVGIFAFLLSVGAWFTAGIVPVIVFAVAAVLGALSMKKISKDPEHYTLKTLSFLALLISLVGFTIFLFSYVLILFS